MHEINRTNRKNSLNGACESFNKPAFSAGAFYWRMRASNLCSLYIPRSHWTAMVIRKNPEIARHILIFERFLCMCTSRAENRWKFAALTCPDFRRFSSPASVFPIYRLALPALQNGIARFSFFFTLLLYSRSVRKVTSFYFRLGWSVPSWNLCASLFRCMKPFLYGF